MRVAIAGCGTMGNQYADDLSKMDDIQLVGAYAKSPEKAKAFADKYGTEGFISFERMIEATNPDVICITLPTHLHKEFVLKAAGYGKPILCEKPIALSLSDAKDMVLECERNGVKLYIGHVLRFFPEYKAIHDQVASGSIGRVGVAHTKRVAKYPLGNPDWYADSAKSGGVIMDLMIHDIDFMRWTVGEVSSVYAIGRQLPGMDYALVTLRFHSGAIANLEAFWGYPGPFTTAIELAGDKGIVRNDNQSTVPIRLIQTASRQSTGGKVDVPLNYSVHSPYYDELRHFMDCIRSGEEPIISPLDAVKAIEIAEAALRSLKTGQPVLLEQK